MDMRTNQNLHTGISNNFLYVCLYTRYIIMKILLYALIISIKDKNIKNVNETGNYS